MFIIPLSVFAGSNYTHPGGTDYNYLGGSNRFTSQQQTESRTKGLTWIANVPLIADLDGNGVNEIIVQDNDGIRIYQNKTLDPVLNGYIDYGSYSWQHDSNMILFDIDLDGSLEIIYVEGTATNQVNMIQWNRSGITNTVLALGTTISASQIGCQMVSGRPVCLIGYANYYISSNAHGLFTMYFNATAKSTTPLTIIGYSSNQRLFCTPQIKSMITNDYDSDDYTEFIFSNTLYDTGITTEQGVISIVYPQPNVLLTPNIDGYILQDLYNFASAGSLQCTGSEQFFNKFTAPMVENVGASGEKLIIVGTAVDSNEFKIRSYKADKTYNDEYPDTLWGSDGAGIIISNPMLFKAFPDNTGRKDFCMVGFDTNTQKLDLLCGTESTNWYTQQHVEFLWDVDVNFNISDSLYYPHIISHSVDILNTLVGGENNDELLTAYGTFELYYNNLLCLLGYCELRKLWANPITTSMSMIPVDVLNSSYDDIIGASSTNLYYFDDNFVNTPAQVEFGQCNPACNQVTPKIWKVNTTAQINVKCEDFNENDIVRAKAILFYGDPILEMNSSWSSYGSQETTFTFPFARIGNISSNNKVAFMCNDNVDNETVDVEISYFSVANFGLEYNDEISTEYFNSDVNISEEDVTTPSTNNTIDAVILNASDTLGGVGTTVIWLLFMLIAGFLPFLYNSQSRTGYDSHTLLIFSGAIEIILFVLGVMLGYISYGIMWTIIILCLGVLGLFIKNKFFGTPTN